MSRVNLARAAALALSALAAAAQPPEPIDAALLDAWSAPYRNWHYYPDHVIPAKPKVPGLEEFAATDCPTVFQLPGEEKWRMSFIAFDGRGYNSFIAESTDLVRWTNARLARGFGPPGEFDHGGCVLGAYLYESWDIKAPRRLARRDDKFWSLYGCYPRQGGYELRPGYEGLAASADGLTWARGKDTYILSVHEPEVGTWEKDCIYQPWLIAHEGVFYNFYNAAQGGIEQTGLAVSGDLRAWTRHGGNPVIRNRPGGYDERFCSDPKVFRDGDHFTMFYFGVGRGGAHIMCAFSRNLLDWTAHPEPLYKAGGHPLGLDATYAHKISLTYNPANDTFYMHYCAVGRKGRGIGLLTSKPLAGVARVLPEGGPPPKDMVKRALLRRVDAARARWEADYAAAVTPEAIAARQARLRAKFLAAIGGLPERTPLAPRVTGVLARDDWRVEKVLFESRPKFFVTGALFLPDPARRPPPYPGVLIPCGHADNAKAYETYQTMAAALARHGMAAFVFDPIDQGERFQLLDTAGKPVIGGTTAHTMTDVGCVLLGSSVARFEIWDGMRALDYLASRPEVDPERLGITGNSGGGTQSSYLMALDERIKVAAPSCYLTSMQALLHTIGPQDGEQNIFGQLDFGMDHADYVMMRAPAPFLICAATKDFFDIAGTWDTFRFAKRLYTRMGFAERVEIMENDAPHNYNVLQRQSCLRWLARWLLGNDAPLTEGAIAPFTDEELRVTPGGQVMLLPGARSTYDFIAEEAAELAARFGLVVHASLFEAAGEAEHPSVGAVPAGGGGFNTAIAVGPDGELLARTRKLHIPVTAGYYEDRYFAPGDTGYPVVDVGPARIGLPTCWDQWFPEPPRAYSLAGADLLVYPTAIGSEPDHPGFDTRPLWQQVIVGNGIANGLAMVAVNRIGTERATDLVAAGTALDPPDTAITFYGSSFISDPYGRILAQAPRDAEAVLVADVDLDAKRDWLELFPLLNTRRPDTYGSMTAQ